MFDIDWNSVRYLIAVAQTGSFRKASIATETNISTISRNISEFERRIGTALFTRTRGGVVPTEAGVAMIAAATRVAKGMTGFAEAYHRAEWTRSFVRVASTPGIMACHLVPAFACALPTDHPLSAGAASIQPEDGSTVMFAELGSSEADIEVGWVLPDRSTDTDEKMFEKIGYMVFRVATGRVFLERHGAVERWDDLRRHRLVHMPQYDELETLVPWNDLRASVPERSVITVPSVTDHTRMLAWGVGVVAEVACAFERDLVLLGIDAPPMGEHLWMAMRRTSMRSPAVRRIAMLIANLFRTSPWFADR